MTWFQVTPVIILNRRNAVELVLKAINNGIIHLDPNKNTN